MGVALAVAARFVSPKNWGPDDWDAGNEDWPMPGNTAYCLAKGGMRMLTRTAGVELAPHGILVVGVGPGAVATPINLSTMRDPTLMAKLDAAIPLRRMAQPEEIANVVVFLAGDGGKLPDRDDDFRGRRDNARAASGCSAMTERYDVIIIGSGAGGGTLAHRLAPSGKQILILERGDWLPREAHNWSARSCSETIATSRRRHGPARRDAVPAAGSLLRRRHHQALRRGALSAAQGGFRRDAASRRRLARLADQLRRIGALLHAGRAAVPSARPTRRDPTEPPASAPYPAPPVSHEPRIQKLFDDLTAAGYHPFPRLGGDAERAGHGL